MLFSFFKYILKKKKLLNVLMGGNFPFRYLRRYMRKFRINAWLTNQFFPTTSAPNKTIFLLSYMLAFNGLNLAYQFNYIPSMFFKSPYVFLDFAFFKANNRGLYNLHEHAGNFDLVESTVTGYFYSKAYKDQNLKNTLFYYFSMLFSENSLHFFNKVKLLKILSNAIKENNFYTSRFANLDVLYLFIKDINVFYKYFILLEQFRESYEYFYEVLTILYLTYKKFIKSLYLNPAFYKGCLVEKTTFFQRFIVLPTAKSIQLNNFFTTKDFYMFYYYYHY